MRPVLLDMHGFASFREPTRVDFDGADFFALIGPTGSGKSTVIDAMTFALYGSVPRWGRKGMVSLALAPTVDRGTVKLIFEVGPDRYVAARELRRTGSRVSQRAASLERLASPAGLAEPGEHTTPLAKDVDGVTDAVTRLLGLSYEDFTQCVVLPQGDFQKFLHAKPSDRQEILLRLLGAENYKQMMSKANQRAASAEQRAATIGETLRGYGDATPEAYDAAVAAEAALGELSGKVTAALPRVSSARAELAAAEDRLRTLRAEHALLSEPAVPPDAAEIDQALLGARQAVADRRAAEKTAEEADTAARAALAQGPRRTPLELTRARRVERARTAASVPDLESAVAGLSGRAAEAASAVADAERDLERARERRDTADRAVSSAAELVTRLRDEQAVLSSVPVPPDVAMVDAGITAARSALAAADTELRTAETAEAAAAEARSAAAPQAPLLKTMGDLDQLCGLLPDLEDARRAVSDASVAAEAAEAAVTAAEDRHRQRREALEDARRAHVVAGLRTHLAVGEACPLCEQTVTTLPDVPETLSAGKTARASADEAEQELKQAQAAAGAARAKAARAESTLESAVSLGNGVLTAVAEAVAGPLAGLPLPAVRQLAGTRLAPAGPADSPLTGWSGPGLSSDAPAPGADLAGPAPSPAPGADLAGRAHAEADTLLKDRERVERDAEQAARTANAARTRHRKAQAALNQAEEELASAREKLRAARDPLVPFGAPQAAGATLAEAWTALSAWAAGQAAERSAGLAGARQTEQTARADHASRTGEFTAAERGLAHARQRADAAGTSEQKARAELGQATARIAELDQLLAGQPDEREIAERLALLDRLEAAAAAAGEDLRRARAARAQGETDLAGHEQAAREAQAALSAARDRVVSLGAPALGSPGPGAPGLGSSDGISAGWTALVTWAREQALIREEDIAKTTAAADQARSQAGARAGQLAADLADAGITVDPERVADTAQAAVAAEREKARAEVKRVSERQAEAGRLLERQTEAQEEQQVAKLLGDLLRANAFQRWLVGAALEDLVTHASATLSALSSGQFDLAYDDGDFYVIDHADADTRRSVRTLSGGETFQASLALALALSSQISALAAAGAARLDSIFLDEGFGTLDPETLDVVATTLEALAQGDRMVGVVTHVGALAERVPVRFRVTRETRSSTVTREGLDPMTTEELA